MVNTGAALKSTIEIRQFQVYKRLFKNMKLDTSKERLTANLGIGKATSIGLVNMHTSIELFLSGT